MIFISHASSRTPDEQAFVRDLAERLTAHFEGVQVFIDHNSITPGSHWRERILRGLGQSNVVIAVLGKDALNTPVYPWVQTELTIARWKQFIQPPGSTLLLGLLYGAGTAATFDQSVSWQPMQMGELQFCKQGDLREFSGIRCPDETFEQIVTQVGSYLEPDHQDPYVDFVQMLTKLLVDASIMPVTEAKTDKQVDTLISHELAGLLQLVSQNGKHLRPDKIRHVLDMLTPLWVPADACGQLAQVKSGNAQSPSGPGKFAVRCEIDPFTPECYLAQTDWQPFSSAWPAVRLEHSGAEMTEQQVADTINQQLIEKLGWFNLKAHQTDKINQRLKRNNGRGHPVFVLIDPSFVHRHHPNILDFVCRQWPQLHQLILLDHDTPVPRGYIELTTEMAQDEDGQWQGRQLLALENYQDIEHLIQNRCYQQ